jgi:hypothetical protein
VVVASSPLLDDGNNSQPVTSRGLDILEPTSRVEIDLAVLSMESNVGLAGNCKQSTPPHKLPPPHMVSLRPQSIEILVTDMQRPPMAPVTVKTATDESDVSKCHSCGGLTFVGIGDLYHPGTSAGYMEKCFDCFCQACPEPEVPVEDIMGTDGEDEAAIMAELLDHTQNTCVSSGRSHSSHNMEFVEHTMCTHVNHAEQFTKDAFEANCKALKCIRESMEQAQHAQMEAACTRQHFDKLLSVSLWHHEHLQAKCRGVEDNVNTSLCNAIDVQCKQAE